MYKIGMSTCGGKSMEEEGFRAMRENGIDAIEISLRSEAYPELDYKKVKKLADQYGVDLWSYHLPFGPFSEIEPSVADPAVRKYTFEYLSGMIEKGADIGIDKFIIHPSGEPIAEEDRAERMKYSMEMMDKFAEFAHRQGAVMLVEDLPRTCLGRDSDDILQLLSANDKLRVCFDTNHLLKEDPMVFLDRVGDKVASLHISDYDFVDERHWIPGQGDMDWVAFVNKLEEIQYKGVWMYEISFYTPEPILGRQLAYADFVENAKAIFARKNPAELYQKL